MKKTKSTSLRRKRPTRAPAERSTISKIPSEVARIAQEIKSILVPIDFSIESEKALSYALAFSCKFGAKVILLHVIEPIPTPSAANSLPLMMENEKVVERSKDRINQLTDRLKINPKRIDRKLVRYGRAFNEIADAARTLKADLIIISTHGYTGLKHVVLGSTTERVVRYAPCPVLVLRSH